jgi:NTE family protein
VSASGGRALVLGGGGVTGIGWEVGVLAALAAGGVPVTSADLLVGTSAGSVVAAQVATGVDLEQAYAAQLAPPSGELAARLRPGTMALMGWALVRSRSPDGLAQRMGRVALATRTVPEERRRTVIASRLPVTDWPQRRLVIVAVDAVTGEPALFERGQGVDLVDAVAASCAVPGIWPPVSIGGRRFVDGGVRSITNADLAAGCDPVLVLAPSEVRLGRIARLAGQVRGLEQAGASVRVLEPDQLGRREMGRNALDPAHRAAAARTGRRQAEALLAADPELLRDW